MCSGSSILLVMSYSLLITVLTDDDDNDDDNNDSGAGDSDGDDSHFIGKESEAQIDYPAIEWLRYSHRSVLCKSLVLNSM